MTWILREERFWVIILALVVILVGPLILVWLILNLPPPLRLVATILILIGWGVAAGYKDWIISKRKQKEKSAS